MDDATLSAEIAGARAYQALFVPSLIGVFAPIVADAASIAVGDRVLDVACGTGVLTRAGAARVGAGGEVAGLDPNRGMLTVAREQSPAIAWHEGTAESLPFSDGRFDAVVSQFGLMFFADRRAALGEMRRVLRPGGRLAIAVWDSLAAIPAFAAEVALFQRIAGQRRRGRPARALRARRRRHAPRAFASRAASTRRRSRRTPPRRRSPASACWSRPTCAAGCRSWACRSPIR